MFVPLTQVDRIDPTLTLVVEARPGARGSLERSVSDALARVDGRAAFTFGWFSDLSRIPMAQERLVAMLSGFFGGSVDFVLMRLTDVMLTLPALFLAMALVSVLRPSLFNILIVIGLVSWTGVARVIRAETMSMAQRDFVLGARALGASPKRLILRHVFPNVMPIIVVMAVLGTSGTLLLDAGLSFLGLGVPPPTPSWGRMIDEATTYFRTAPWLAVFPGIAIFYAVLAFNLLGYGYLRRRGRSSVSQPGATMEQD